MKESNQSEIQLLMNIKDKFYQIKIMRDFFIQITYPHILGQPAKSNEEMEKIQEQKLLRSYTNFTASQFKS
ncbi:unnamed protein product [Paramecium sonneborni]|nr:unnamed protein product [Paramecium sonneborni]